jgi:zinc transporter ZupT
MFVSTKASSALGLSVSIALSIHNLTEGFMIALPLYYATRSRLIAFSAASLMGGLSQPLGALVGLLLVKNISKSKEDVIFGAIFACISGMMSLITIQVNNEVMFIRMFTDIFFLNRACYLKLSEQTWSNAIFFYSSF